MDIEKFKKDMAVFSFGHHQDALTYFITLKRGGWTIDDARSWIESEQVRQTTINKISDDVLTKICSECQSLMIAVSVNTGPDNQTGDDSKLVYTCINRECMHQIYEQ